MRKYLGKIVRDKVPDIIRSEGYHVESTSLGDVSFERLLCAKLDEETSELRDAISEGNREHILEEMADVAEVLHALMERLNIREYHVLIARLQKIQEKGSFSTRQFIRFYEKVTP